MNTPWRGVAGLVLVVLAMWGGMQLFEGWRARELGQQVASRAKPGDIVMVSSVTCPYCKQAREWFADNKVVFSECFIEKEPACAAVYNALQQPGTPVLVVRGKRQVGFDAQRVAQALPG
jgi:glutaredoxin